MRSRRPASRSRPFGVIPPEENDGNPTADLEFLWNDGAVNFIGHTLDELEVVDGWLRCELLNRHDTHTQTLMPMSGDAIVVVAPGDVDFSEPAHFDTVRAFVMPRHTLCTSAPRHLALGPLSPGRPVRAHLQRAGPWLRRRQRNRVAHPRSRRRLRGPRSSLRHRALDEEGEGKTDWRLREGELCRQRSPRSIGRSRSRNGGSGFRPTGH